MSDPDCRKYPNRCAIERSQDHVPVTGQEGKIIWDSTGTLPDYDIGTNQWVGPLTREMISDWGKFVTFGPAPAGLPSGIEALVLILGLKKLSETPEGIRALQGIARQYLESMGRVLVSLHHASASNPFTNLVNTYQSTCIFQRMGLMSPHDATQTRAWIDHIVSELLKVEYTDLLGNMVSNGVQTLVNSTNDSRMETKEGTIEESYKGLGALANLAGIKAFK